MRSSGDRMSDLPAALLENILGRLPAIEAVRTSVLSKKMKDKWIDIPNLIVFDYYHADWDQFAKFVYHLLLSHRGHIQIFKFFMSKSEFSQHNLDQHLPNWIDFLSRSNIQQLVLNLTSCMDFSMLFNCNQLRCLSITSCCILAPKIWTTNFSNLQTLQLAELVASDDFVKTLVCCCPVLERLLLLIRYQSILLEINAPNLKFLYLQGCFQDIRIENSPYLTDATFDRFGVNFDTRQISSLVNFDLVHKSGKSLFERLTLSGYFVEGLGIGQGVSIAYENLEFLRLSLVQFDNLLQITVAFELLRAASNIRELHVSVTNDDVNGPAEEYMTTLNESNWCFKHLRVVEINFSRHHYLDKLHEDDLFLDEAVFSDEAYLKSYLKLIGILLVHSPVLETMTINYKSPTDDSLYLMRHLLSCKRAAPEVKFKINFK